MWNNLQIKQKKIVVQYFFFQQKKNAILLVLSFKESSIQPELSSPPPFRIQGGYSERDKRMEILVCNIGLLGMAVIHEFELLSTLTGIFTGTKRRVKLHSDLGFPSDINSSNDTTDLSGQSDQHVHWPEWPEWLEWLERQQRRASVGKNQ